MWHLIAKYGMGLAWSKPVTLCVTVWPHFLLIYPQTLWQCSSFISAPIPFKKIAKFTGEVPLHEYLVKPCLKPTNPQADLCPSLKRSIAVSSFCAWFNHVWVFRFVVYRSMWRFGLSVLEIKDFSDACNINPPPPNMIFQHSSTMISMNTGNPALSKVPCAYRLSTNEPKHWQSLCDTCDDSCVCTTQHAILPTCLQCFQCLELSVLIEHYVTSRTTHHAPWSSNHIDHDCDSLFGFRSCWKHAISNTISVEDFYTSMGVLKQTPAK